MLKRKLILSLAIIRIHLNDKKHNEVDFCQLHCRPFCINRFVCLALVPLAGEGETDEILIAWQKTI